MNQPNQIVGICFFIVAMVSTSLLAQEKNLYGKILNESEIEGIHILNITSNTYAITDATGAFNIKVRVNDSIIISSVKYIPEKIGITETIYDEGTVLLTLRELRNELDEVLLGPNLTGNLRLDVQSIAVVDSLNFYDVGIPGFQGEPRERIPNLVGQVITPLSVDLEGLYKHFSGYYKTLRTIRKWKSQEETLHAIINHYNTQFFIDAYGIPEKRLEDFIQFCIETSTIQNDFTRARYALVIEVFERNAPIYLSRISEKKE